MNCPDLCNVTNDAVVQFKDLSYEYHRAGGKQMIHFDWHIMFCDVRRPSEPYGHWSSITGVENKLTVSIYGNEYIHYRMLQKYCNHIDPSQRLYGVIFEYDDVYVITSNCSDIVMNILILVSMNIVRVCSKV